MDIATWVGFAVGFYILVWAVNQAGVSTLFLNWHGLIIVVGGVICAILVNSSFRTLFNAGRAFLSIFFPSGIARPDQAITEIVRLSERARAEGGLLALQNEGGDFARGFLKRALSVALVCGESHETRRILEDEIRQIRIRRQEDANVFRTMGVLAPMFGLLGTLLGIVQVLRTMSEPTKVGSAMALAITTAFYGIALSNMVCVPVAGKIRSRAIQETLLLEIVLEGVLDLLESKSPYLVETHLSAYAMQRRRALEAPRPAEVAAPEV